MINHSISWEDISFLIPWFDESDIQGIHEFDMSPAINNINKKAYVATCHSIKYKTSFAADTNSIVVIHNTHIVSLFYNIALFKMAFMYYPKESSLSGKQFAELAKSLGKVFVSERIYHLKNCHMARTLLLEASINYEGAHRVLFELSENTPILKNSSLMFARIASDFTLHHEIGHNSQVDERFSQFVDEAINEYLCEIELTDDLNIAHLKYEMYADIFSINCCIARYSTKLSETNLREYLKFIISMFSTVNALYLFAEDTYRINVDNSYKSFLDINKNLLSLSHRESLMFSYVSSFVFDKKFVECVEFDNLLNIGNDEVISSIMIDTEFYVREHSESSRRISELISRAFDSNQGFDYFINNSKTQRNLS